MIDINLNLRCKDCSSTAMAFPEIRKQLDIKCPKCESRNWECLNNSLIKNSMKKAPIKKESKKAVKLIEGKYSHKFLTRLSPAEGKHLSDMMKDENLKTFTSAVTFAIMNFKIMKDALNVLHKKVNELEHKNGEIVETVADYIEVQKRLSGLKLPKRF